MDLSIVIVNFKTPKLCENCIDSIRETMGGSNYTYEVILVDNHSDDGQFARLKKLDCDNVHVYETECNGGFGYGNNYGVQRSCGRLLFFLNSDTLLYPDVLPRMIRAMEQDNSIGAMSCLMVDGNNDSLVVGHAFENTKTLFMQTIIKPITPAFIQKRRGERFSNQSGDALREVDWVSGAGLLISRVLFDAIGGWNEQFFMYMEDEELCYRVHQKGHKCVIFHEKGIQHLVGKSGGSAFSSYERYKSKIIYFRLTDSEHFGVNRILLFIQAKHYMRHLSKKERNNVIRRLKEFCNE